MKKFRMISILITLIFVFSSCNSTQTKEIVNGYQSNGNGKIEWFEIAPEDFIAQLNEKTKVKDYPKLIKLKTDSDRMYSDNGETWYILADSYESEYDPKEAFGKLKDVEISLFAEDPERAEKNGYYINALIDMFNPGMAEQVTKELYIYNEVPKDSPLVRKVNCGNTVYTYIASEGKDSPEFHISPAKVEVVSQGNLNPINPNSK